MLFLLGSLQALQKREEKTKKTRFLPFLKGEQFHYHRKKIHTKLFKVHMDFSYKSLIYCRLVLFIVYICVTLNNIYKFRKFGV